MDRIGCHEESQVGLDVMCNQLQMTKSVPFGWKAGAGLLQLPGLVFAGTQGPVGVELWCMKPDVGVLLPEPI